MMIISLLDENIFGIFLLHTTYNFKHKYLHPILKVWLFARHAQNQSSGIFKFSHIFFQRILKISKLGNISKIFECICNLCIYIFLFPTHQQFSTFSCFLPFIIRRKMYTLLCSCKLLRANISFNIRYQNFKKLSRRADRSQYA